jgi:hypothetical protein
VLVIGTLRGGLMAISTMADICNNAPEHDIVGSYDLDL